MIFVDISRSELSKYRSLKTFHIIAINEIKNCPIKEHSRMFTLWIISYFVQLTTFDFFTVLLIFSPLNIVKSAFL